MARQDLQDREAPQEMLDQREKEDIKDYLVQRESQVAQALLVHEDLLGSKVHQVSLEYPGNQVLMEVLE
jgi:hypothetical protein